MRPRLNPDVGFVRIPGGVRLLCDRGTETFHGPSIYAWIERLAPHLDGRSSLAEITAGLHPDRAGMVRDIVGALIDRGLARDLDRDEPHTLSEAELDRYAAEIALIESFRDSGARRFQRHRESRMLAAGSGASFLALVHAAVRTGVREITAARTGECRTDTGRLAELVAAAADPEQAVGYAWWDGTAEAAAALVHGHDVVLHSSDRPMPARARLLERLAMEAGALFVTTAVDGDTVWVGPTATGSGRLTFASAWTRKGELDAARGRAEPAFADDPGAPVAAELSGAAAALAGGLAAMAAFRRVTGVAGTGPPGGAYGGARAGARGGARTGEGTAPGSGTMTLLDLATLATSTHRFVAHPREDPPAGHRAPVPAGTPMTWDDFDRAVVRLIDGRLGVIGEVSERDFAQVPLNVAAATVAVPAPLGPVAIGAGPDFRTARLRAARAALERYAYAAHQARAAERAGDPLAAAVRLAGAGRGAPPYPPRSRPGPLPPGVASAPTWDEAVHRGLAAHCLRLTAAEPARPGGPAVIDPAGLAGPGSIGADYLEMIRTAGIDLAVYDVTGRLGVPCLAFRSGGRSGGRSEGRTGGRTGGRTVGRTCSTDPGEALTDGLELVLLDYQARTHAQPGYAPPPVPALPVPALPVPAPGRDGRADPGPGGLPRAAAADPAAGVRQMTQALVAAGHDPWVIPLDGDPAVRAVLPYAVHVVLAGAAR